MACGRADLISDYTPATRRNFTTMPPKSRKRHKVYTYTYTSQDAGSSDAVDNAASLANQDIQYFEHTSYHVTPEGLTVNQEALEAHHLVPNASNPTSPPEPSTWTGRSLLDNGEITPLMQDDIEGGDDAGEGFDTSESPLEFPKRKRYASVSH